MGILKYLVALAVIAAITIVCLLEVSRIERVMHELSTYSGAQTPD